MQNSADISEMLTSGESEGGKIKSNIIACIPAYNTEQSIEEVVKETLKHVTDVIVIDDGSYDRTAEVAERAGAIILKHVTNMGYGAALRSGFSMALQNKADIIVTLDGDLQHNPDHIPSLVKPILDGKAEIVIGARVDEDKRGIPAYRKTGVRVITKLVQYSGIPASDAQSGFRAYSARALRMVLPNLTNTGFGLSTELLAEAARYNFLIAEVPIVIRYNTGVRTSTKNPLSHGADVVYSLIYYISERRPLLTIGLPGIIFLAVGIVGMVNVLEIFNKTRQFAIGTGIFTIGAVVLGVILVFTAVILIVLKRLSIRISNLE